MAMQWLRGLSTRPSTHSGNCFDLLRFALASLVIFSHAWPLATGSEDFEPLVLLTRHQTGADGKIITIGSLAVDCFFIISGYLIAQSWVAKPDAFAFMKKRVLRIYPGFIVAALLGAFVIPALFSHADAAPISVDFVRRFFTQLWRLSALTPRGVFPDNPAPGTVNGALWSIPFEFWCYIGVLACGFAGALRLRAAFVVAFVLLLLVGFAFAWSHYTPGGRWLGAVFGYPPFWVRLLPFFLGGMIFFLYRDRIRLHRLGALAAVVLLLVGSQIPYGWVLVLPPAACYLVFWLAFLPAPRLQHFARSGDYSYGIYLYGFPAMQVMASLLDPGRTPLQLFVMSYPLALACGFLSWHLLEKHCVRHKPPAISRPAVPIAG